jgi:hypothetical protein
MNPRRLAMAAIWASSAWPALNFIAANYTEVRRGGVQSIAGVLAITLFIGATGSVLYGWRARAGRGDRLLLAWLVGICLTFGYMAIRNMSALLLRSAGLALPPSLGWLLAVAGSLYIVWKFGRHPNARPAAVTFSLVAAALACVSLATAAMRSNEVVVARPVPLNTDVPAATTEGGVDVYYLILDTYAGSRGLSEVLQFDNSGFLARMERRGFRDVSSESSNYLKTAQTLGAIFALDYPMTDDPQTWTRVSRLYPALFDAGQAPALISRLRAAGYTTWYSGSFLTGCPTRHFHCLGGTAVVEPDYMTQSFLASTPLGRALMHLLEPRRDALDPLADQLYRTRAARHPSFVFAHHLAPHPPYTLDQDCRARLDEGDARQGYLDAVICVNRKVEQLVDRILAMDPRALIVLQGDHGSEFTIDWQQPIADWPPAAIRERTSFLNLVRAPPACEAQLDRPLGQVNTARFVIACAEGQPVDYLPENTYLSTYANGPDARVVRSWRPSN